MWVADDFQQQVPTLTQFTAHIQSTETYLSTVPANTTTNPNPDPKNRHKRGGEILHFRRPKYLRLGLVLGSVVGFQFIIYHFGN